MSANPIYNLLLFSSAFLLISFTFWSDTSPSLLLLLSLIILLSSFIIFWETQKTPILLFIILFQWLQISSTIFLALSKNQEANSVLSFEGDNEQAIFLSLIGLCFFMLGIYITSKTKKENKEVGIFETKQTRKYFSIYLLFYLISVLSGFLYSLSSTNLIQLLYALSSLRWVFFFILTYVTFSHSENTKIFWFIAFSVEFLLSIGSFFSDFKIVILFTIFGIIATHTRLALSRMLFVTFLCISLIGLAITWTAVKKDYREYASDGNNTQAVQIDFSERLEYLQKLTSNLSDSDIKQAFYEFLERLSYVNFFGVVLQEVPEYIPHQSGAIWLDAFIRPFTPRILFPEKTAINDSERTNYFTGLNVAGNDRGTSVSLGYMAEAYIDFGKTGMMLVIFLYGCFIGLVYRWFTNIPDANGLLGMGLATHILYTAAPLESSITKVFGGLMISIVFGWILIRVTRALNWFNST